MLWKKLHLKSVKLVKLQGSGFISAVWLSEDTVSPVPWCSLGWPWASTGWFQRPQGCKLLQCFVKECLFRENNLGSRTEPAWEVTKPRGKASSREEIRCVGLQSNRETMDALPSLRCCMRLFQPTSKALPSWAPWVSQAAFFPSLSKSILCHLYYPPAVAWCVEVGDFNVYTGFCMTPIFFFFCQLTVKLKNDLVVLCWFCSRGLNSHLELFRPSVHL